MKVRSLAELDEILDTELAWRKKELTTLQFSALSAGSKDFPVFARAGIPMLYAHWEGFARTALFTYGTYIAAQKFAYKDLVQELYFQELRGTFNKEMEFSSKNLIEFMKVMNQSSTKIFSNFPQERVESSSNFNGEVANRELTKLGLSPSHIETLFPKLDSGLIHVRNRIAHGERIQLSKTDFEDYYRLTQDLMRRLEIIVRNGAAQKTFLIKSPTYSSDTSRPPQTTHP
jgi:MAE_28990/MAE_18760-like HEPN